MKVKIPPGEVLVVEIQGSDKLILIETTVRCAKVWTAEPEKFSPDKIYDEKFTLSLTSPETVGPF